MKRWFVFRDSSKTLFGYGTEQDAARYLRRLNEIRAINHFTMDAREDVFPTPSIAELESHPDRVDLEQAMRS